MENASYRYHFNNVDHNCIECAGFSLLQYGELWCNPGSEIPVHRQCCYEITYIIDGVGTVTAEDHVYSVQKNDCLISFPDEAHRICSGEEHPLRFVFVGFRMGKSNPSVAGLFEELTRLFRDSDGRCVSVPDRESLFVRFFSEMKSDYPFRHEVAGYLLAEFLIDCIRSKAEKRTENSFPKITDDAVLVYGIETYIAGNIRSIPNLQALETVFHYHYSYLSKRFFRITGQRLNEYFLACKMKEANRLLRQGFSVTQVSELLNYSSIHSFSRSYKQHFGYPPSERNGAEQA